MALRKALIPAAGRGTRMRPVTWAVPKELLPVGTRPAIHRVVEEAAGAGLDRVGVVIGPGKELIREYLETARRNGEFAGLDFEYLHQEEPNGLAEAVSLARGFTDGEPFALLLPDNVLLAPDYRLTSLVDLFTRSGKDVVGVLELDSGESGRYGNSGLFEGSSTDPGVFEIRRLRDKRPGRLVIPPGETVLRTCGRYVCRPHVMGWIDELRPGIEGEFDEVPVYQKIAAAGGLLGRVLPPPLFDVGHRSGFLAANAYLHHRAAED
jgi:UTP--glucose-1-phosphate uridylyltransferase